MFTGYDPSTLPFNPSSNASVLTTSVTVIIQLEIYGINYIDLIAGYASVQGALREWWSDTSMTWNASDYGGVTELIVSTDPIDPTYGWTPDI